MHKIWRSFCHFVVKVFYRKCEVVGGENIPASDGIIFCANHVNALVDALIIQAAIHRAIRPLARSGLFDIPLLGRILHSIGAVPVYRRQDSPADTGKNQDSFAACYELLNDNETLIIFPEGQSHSDPYLHELKTGAARIALGAQKNNGKAPLIIPVGLTFTKKGNFRGDVLVNIGTPVDLSIADEADEHNAVRTLTSRITDGLKQVTLNADSWQDIELLARIERFFATRQGRYRNARLSEKFEAVQRLIEGYRVLIEHEPDKVRTLMRNLRMFERLSLACGIKDYQLTLEYRPLLITFYVLRTLTVILLGFPLMVWGVLNSLLPFMLTRHFAHTMAKGRDQYDTAKIIIGSVLFLLFWGIQVMFVYFQLNAWWALAYAVSLLISAPVALKMKKEYRYALNNVRTFFLFMRKHELKEYMQMKQREIVVELAQLVRIAKRLERLS